MSVEVVLQALGACILSQTPQDMIDFLECVRLTCGPMHGAQSP